MSALYPEVAVSGVVPAGFAVAGQPLDGLALDGAVVWRAPFAPDLAGYDVAVAALAPTVAAAPDAAGASNVSELSGFPAVSLACVFVPSAVDLVGLRYLYEVGGAGRGVAGYLYDGRLYVVATGSGLANTFDLGQVEADRPHLVVAVDSAATTRARSVDGDAVTAERVADTTALGDATGGNAGTFWGADSPAPIAPGHPAQSSAVAYVGGRTRLSGWSRGLTWSDADGLVAAYLG